MKKASEYREHAEECRVMANRTANAAHKASLIQMAETAENLAREREERVARQVRIAALNGI